MEGAGNTMQVFSGAFFDGQRAVRSKENIILIAIYPIWVYNPFCEYPQGVSTRTPNLF